MCRFITLACLLVAMAGVAGAEEIFRDGFDAPSDAAPLKQTWGDAPAHVEVNAVVPGAGVGGGPGARLRLAYPEELKHRLSYFTYTLKEPMPVIPELKEISFRVKANVPVHLKVPIGPYGFIYHAPGAGPSQEWQRVTLARAYDELKAWCDRGGRSVEGAFITGIIVAVVPTKGGVAEVSIDEITMAGSEGARAAAREERIRRRTRKVRVSVVSQIWSDEGRTLEAVLEKIDEAARDGADIVSLPMECVKTEGEPIPGPISQAIAARAAKHKIWVVGNIREREGEKRFVTSFLCDRAGQIVGKYRKSHKMPDETMDLGDDLPVFQTDFGKIAMRIGSDRFFPDIDHVYTVKGASLILWAQQPEPVEDEFSQDFPSEGRATDYHVHIACSRYASAGQGWITNKFPPYCGMPIGRAYVINREGQRVACTPRMGGGVATAALPFDSFGPGRQAPRNKAFAALTAPVQVPERKQWKKRKVRVTAIEAHLGIEELLAALDEAGHIGTDIACTYEFVWISGPDPERIARMTETARANVARVAEKAKQYGMYVILAGVVERIERNEAILFGRDGQVVGRYYKIAKTHPEMICGEETPVFETDFGRVAMRICADEWMVELDRCYGLKGADILFVPTQSWGPDALFRDQRDISRAMDAGLFHVQATHPSSEVRHRSVIIEPTGAVVARSEYRMNSIVSAVIDLDNDRPLRYIRDYKPHTPGGYMAQYQPDRMPAAANDLRETILRQRRPELYGVLASQTETQATSDNPLMEEWGAPPGLLPLLRYS